jgi:hypothetical protein
VCGCVDDCVCVAVPVTVFAWGFVAVCLAVPMTVFAWGFVAVCVSV